MYLAAKVAYFECVNPLFHFHNFFFDEKKTMCVCRPFAHDDALTQ